MARSGEILDRKYRLERRLGKGGMGEVWAAEHVALGKHVAIKILHEAYADDLELVRRFQVEARAIAAIGHRNIVAVHDVGTAPDGSPFIVMDLLSGESLRDRLRRERTLPVRDAVSIAIPVLQALDAAHRRSVIHRDVKPDNVFLEQVDDGPPVPKLLDFGVSKITTGEPGLTCVGTVLGSPLYMPPEQARGEIDIDVRADVYAVGVVLYEMLTGRPPFVSRSEEELMWKIMNEVPTVDIGFSLPSGLEAILLRALAKDRADRQASAAALLHEIAPFAADAGPKMETQRTSPFRRPEAVDPIAATEMSPLPAIVGDHATQTTVFVAREASAIETSTLGPTVPMADTENRGTLGVSIGLFAGPAIVAVVAGAWLLLRPTGPPSLAPDPAARSASGEAIVRDGPLPNPLRAAREGPAPAVPTVPQETPPDRPVDEVIVTLTGAPHGARAWLDGTEVASGPVRLPRAETVRTLRIVAPGWETTSRSIVPDRDQVIEVQMERTPARTVRRSRRARTRPPASQHTTPSKRRILSDTSEFER